MKLTSPLKRLLLSFCVAGLALAAVAGITAAPTGLSTITGVSRGWDSTPLKAEEDAPGVQAVPAGARHEAGEVPALPDASSAERQVQSAWRRAQQAGGYHFSTRVVQTTQPAPKISAVGQGSRTETIYLEGMTDLAAHMMQIRLWPRGGATATIGDSVELRVEGDRAYGRTGEGPWQTVDNANFAFAPANDALAYLAGAKNVRLAAIDPGRASQPSQYTFDLDGPALADHIRGQLEEHLRRAGELPAGIHLDTPNSLRGAVGKGTVLIDQEGLPVRLTMHVEYPQQSNGERVAAELQTDFFDYPPAMLAKTDLHDSQAITDLFRATATGAPQAGTGLVTFGLLLGLVVHRRSKKIYRAAVLSLILAMLVSPLMQSHQVYAWSQEQANKLAAYEKAQKEADAARQYQAMASAAAWDPQHNPIEAAARQAIPALNPMSGLDLDTYLAGASRSSLLLQSTPDPTSDDDGDGLTYAQEIRLGTDPNERDTDADRITDNAEVAGFLYANHRWYSNPNNPDTNDDGQLDTVECWDKVVDPDAGEISPGDTVACQDSDGDGTPDPFDRDDDGDGVPDAVDLSPYDTEDNGGNLFDQNHPLLLQVDGLQAGEPAFVDFQVRPENQDHLWHALNVLDWPSGDEEGQIQRKTDNDSTFESVAQANQPVSANAGNGDMRLIPMLEIEMTGDSIPLRFTNPEIAVEFEGSITATIHLEQNGSDTVLDFSLETGLFDVAINQRACRQLGDDLIAFAGVSNGASRTIAGQHLTQLADGEHGLTLTSGGDTYCLDIGNIVNGSSIDRMVDRAPLDPYGITVREKDDDGTLLAYVPLNLVADENGADRAAFAGRMAYWPATTNWGDTQKVNVVWALQMLTDHRCNQAEEFAGRCAEDEWVLDTLQLVRAYPETWYLTGLAAREDLGLDIAVVYEDPSQETGEERQYDDSLWSLAWGFDKTLLTGRDQDGNGERDITISEIRARWDYPTNQNSGYTNGADALWGVPITATQVVTFAYDLQDQFMQIAMTETEKILDDAFLGYVNAGSDAPTLLFVQESHYRGTNLGDDSVSTEAVSDTIKLFLELDPEESPEETQVTMSWAPYRYQNGQWESYPIDEYWDKMEVRYDKVFTDYQGDPEYDDIRQGQVFIAKMFYLAMYRGNSALVQVGEELIGYKDAAYADLDLEEVLATIEDTGGVTARVTKILAGTFAGMTGRVLEEIDLRDFLKGVHKIDPNGTYSTLFKQQRTEVNKGHLKDGAMVLATGAMMAAYIVAEQYGIEPLTHALNGVVALFSVYTLSSAGIELFQTGKSVAPVSKAVVIGFLITELVTWGVFAYSVFASGLEAGSMAANYAFATQIAASIAGAIMIAIAAIPVVGQIIAAVIGLFDSIVLLACGLADSENPVCLGISGLLVYGIRWTIYSGAIMLDLEDDERLKIHEFSQDFLDSTLGMAVGNSLITEATIRNQVELIDWEDLQYNWMAGLYWWQYSDDTLRSSTFVYHLDEASRDYHQHLGRYGIRNYEWTPGTDGAEAYTYYEDVAEQTLLAEDGINVPIPLYLNESFAVPAQECWLIPILLFGIPAIPVCYVRTERASSNLDLGEHMRFDIFPATLDGFYALTSKSSGYALGWSQDTSPTFSRLKDADGDGLRNRADGGADPDDRKWDTDADGLSDFYELQLGSSPQDVDSDDDGLTDYEETLHKTDPNRADSDFDGLTDGEETTGWEYVYSMAADGSQLKTWVTADPLSIDEDADTLTDFQERTFGFHPRVASDLNILTFNSTVTEKRAPRLLLRLDESGGATAFRDDSGYAHNAACPADGRCPAAGHLGQSGNAPQFDGSNDFLEVAHTDRLNPDRELTLAAWVRLDNPATSQKIMGKTSIGDGYLLGVTGGRLHPELWDTAGTHYAAQWGNISAATWTHIAVTWRSGGSLIGYVNGQQVGQIAAGANEIKAADGPLRIGIAPWDATSFPAGGRIDDVVVIPHELTQSEIAELAAGRHNPEDLAVRPGDILGYQATVKNELFNRYAEGLLSASFPAGFSEPAPQTFVLNPQEAITLTGEVNVGPMSSGVYSLTQEADALITDWREASNYADMLLHLDEPAGATAFEDSSGAQPPRSGECNGGAGQCPLAEQVGRYGYALRFDGQDDMITVDNANMDNPQVLTLAAWVYPNALPNRVMRFVSLGGEKAVLRYDGTSAGGPGQLHFYMKIGGSLRHVRVNNALTAGEWQFVAGSYDGSVMRLYRNGSLIGSLQISGQVSGDNGLRLSHTGTASFDGLLDEVALFPRGLSAEEIAELYSSPIFHMAFDESSGATHFDDDSGFHNDGSCTGARCPASGEPGVTGSALRLDGGDYVAIPNSPVLDLSQTDFTLSAWVYPEGDPALSACPFVAEYFYDTTLNQVRERRCETWPLDRRVNSGQTTSQRWTGTFEFREANTTFETTSDEGYRLYLDGELLVDRWNSGASNYDTVSRLITAGRHTLKVEHHKINNWTAYDQHISLGISPSPLPQAQAILGAGDYPALQRVGNRLRLVLNDTTQFITPDDVLTRGAWNHVAANFDGTTIRLFVNGGQVGEIAASGQVAEGGAAFDIGRATATTALELRTLNVLEIGDGGNAQINGGEYRIRYREGTGAWQEIWAGDHVDAGSYTTINVAKSLSSDATLSIVERDEEECTQLYWCTGDDRQDDQMGTITVPVLSVGPFESVSHLESQQGDKADLFWNAVTDAVPFQGKIDEVSIYPRSLALGDVENLYEAGAVVLRLPLDDAPGATQFVDALGQHNGSCSGTSCPTAGVPGRQELGLLFDGVDDAVTVNNANTGDVQKLTVAAWVNLHSLPSGSMRFLSVGDDKAVLRYQDHGLHFTLKTTDGATHSIESSVAPQTGVWYHLAGSFDGQTMRFYLNGAEVASQALNAALASGETVRLSHPTEALDGNLDEVTIYRRALSAAQIQTLYRAAPELLLRLDDNTGATVLRDATGNGHDGACTGNRCPKAGVKGQIGLAAEFDGANDAIDVPHNDRLNPGDELTLAMWVKLVATNAGQKLIGKSSTGNGYVLGIQNGKMVPEIWDSSGARFSAEWGQITAGYWTHLALTWKRGGNMIGYINGNEVGRVSASANAIKANTNPLRVGAAPWNPSAFPANGRLDQATLFTRALSPREIREMFRLEAKWVEERQPTVVTVDADQPVSTLISDEMYRPNSDAVLLVKAQDATTHVTMEEMGVSVDGGQSYVWQAAPACQDAQAAGAAWCPTFEPTNGEGRYLLQFRATDNVGNRESLSQSATVLVDDTPAAASTTIAQGQILAPQRDPDSETTWQVRLDGAGTDPAVAGSPGSGIARVLVKLTDTDPTTDTLKPQPATLNGTAWQANYRLSAADPTGAYRLSAQTVDRVDNTSDFVPLITLGVDAAPPEASLDDPATRTGVSGTITSTLQLSGRITETGDVAIGVASLRLGFLPAAMASLSNTVAIFHFDEPTGASSFANDTGMGDATCAGTTCPNAGTAGIWGTAVTLSDDFNSSDDYLTADGVSAAFDDAAGLSFGGWVRPEYNPDNRAFLAFNTADGGLRNQIVHDHYSLKYMDGEASILIEHLWNEWGFVMVTIDGDGHGAAYLDGQLKAEFTTSVRPDPSGRFSIGQEWDGTAPSQLFNGDVDEVYVFSRALAPAEVAGLYADATVASSGTGVNSSAWTYALPPTLDGLYEINLRPADVFGNDARRTDWPAWVGEIDTRAPKVKLTIDEHKKTIDAGGQQAFVVKTTYTCWAQDFNLVMDSTAHPAYDFKCPCNTLAPHATTTTDTYYHEVSPWYSEVFSDTARLYEHNATCTVTGPATDNFMQACDTYGHCASQVADVAQAFEQIPSAFTVVLSPAHEEIVTSTGSKTIEARAYARDRIKQVQVYDGPTLIGAVQVDPLCTGNVTTHQWTQAWMATEGSHSLRSLVVPCTGATAYSVSNIVRVDSLAPLAPIWPISLNRQQRLSYARVALSGETSDAPSGTGVARVEVSVDGGDWADASLQGSDWRYEWPLGDEPDNAHFTVAVRATDRAGWSTQAAHAVTVDLDAPNPITLTLTSDAAAGVVPAGQTLRQMPARLDLSWQASEPTDKLLNYQVVWTVETATRTLQIPAIVPPGGPLSSSYLALVEAERIEPSVTSVFNDGNTQVDDWGSVYVDTPLTPDYVKITGYHPYRGWMDSGCSAIGVDRRMEEAVSGGVSLDNPQNFYATWDSEALRLAWTGANWDYNGDLFIYMDTLGDPSVPTTAFNPFQSSQQTTLHIPGAKAFVYVQSSQLATLGYWQGTGWHQRPLDSSQYRFDAGQNGGITDLYIPFDLIGVTDPATTPLVLYAFAVDEGALRLWATMPAQNSLNSPSVANTTLYAGAQQVLQWLHVYTWPSLGPGICPNNPTSLLPLYTDHDLRFEIASDPVGTNYGLMRDDLFWLSEALTDPNRPVNMSQSFAFMDVSHPPVGDGDTIAYTLKYANHGTRTATGATAQATGLCGLQLAGAVTDTLTIPLGDIPAGAAGSVTFSGQVDLAGQIGTCQDWVSIKVLVRDNSYGPLGEPLDWLWSDHQVDRLPPDHLAIRSPEALIGPDDTVFVGEVSDASEVPLVVLESQAPIGGTQQTTCPDDAPADGQWSCTWNATTANGGVQPTDGDQFLLRLRATDSHGLTSDWTAWQAFIVDAVPPTITFGVETAGIFSGTVDSTARLTFEGMTHDNRGASRVQVCLDGDCGWADVLLENSQDGNWSYTVATEDGQDNLPHTATLRAIDLVGSWSQGSADHSSPVARPSAGGIASVRSSSLSFSLDNVAPAITLVGAVDHIEAIPDGSPTRILSGTVSDGSQVTSIYAMIQPPDKAMQSQPVGRNDSGAWWYELAPDTPGKYAIWVNAVDEAGNATAFGPHYLHVTCNSAELAAAIVKAQTVLGGSGPIDITVRVSHGGGDEIPAGLPIAIYQDNNLLQVVFTTRTLAAGESEDLSIAWDVETAGDYVLTVAVNDDGTGAASMALCSMPADTAQAVAILDIPLVEKWNLMSGYVEPVNPAIEVVQRPIDGLYSVIQSYDQGWLSYHPGVPPGPDPLADVDAEHGYWIRVNNGVTPTLRVLGAKLAADAPIELDAGWNLVSYLPRVTLPITRALANIDGYYVAVHGFDHGAQAFYPDLDPSFNTLEVMQPLRGYWIQTTTPVTLRYSSTLGTSIEPPAGIAKVDAGMAVTMTLATNTPLSGKQPTRPFEPELLSETSPTHQWINLYSGNTTVYGDPAQIGAVVDVFDPQGVKCGTFVVSTVGRYGVMPCYRDDPTTPTVDEGAEPGDALSFRIDGATATVETRSLNGASIPSTEVVTWTQNLDRWEVDLSVIPLAVDLSFFTAQAEGDSVRLEWETVSELNHLGFNLYRGPTAEGPWTQLNGDLITSPTPGSPAGAVYQWYDTDILGDEAIWYQLEALDGLGASHLVGLAAVEPEQETGLRLIWLPLMVSE